MLAASLARLVDMRRGEGATLARAVGAVFLLMAAHTSLETARDALLLSRFPSRDLGSIYILAALCVLPFTMSTTRLSLRVGPRRALAVGLGVASACLMGLFAVPVGSVSVLATYVVSCLVGAVLISNFWNLFGSVFTIAQSRRLLGPVAAAGTLGAVGGSGGAAALLGTVPVKALLPISALIAFVTALVLPTELPESRPAGPPEPVTSQRGSSPAEATISNPFVRRVAWLVAASTAALVVLDFTFKWTVARSVPTERVAPFVARYYALLSAAALVAQLFMSRTLVQRFGVARTILVTPVSIVLGGMLAVVLGGTMPVILGLKGVDATLRYSVHRMTTELTYLPLPASVRTRAKPLIDGVVVRVVQGSAGAVLLAAGVGGTLSPRLLLGATVAAGLLWVAAAWAMQRPYLALLRRTIAGKVVGPSSARDPLDVESAEALIGHLSSDDALTVVGAMNALARRGRMRMIPALILLHEDATVLERALSLMAHSDRQDWLARARRLLADQRERVRMAAARALAMHGALRARDLAEDASPRMRAYAALYVALETDRPSALDDPTIAAMIGREGAEAGEEQLGLLSAIADAPRDARLIPLLERIAAEPRSSRLVTVELARAAASQRAAPLIPSLISRLTVRDGREAVREALLQFGDAALDALRAALTDTRSPRALRIHIPNSVARFGTRGAAELLLGTIETDLDGLVRYKATRALGRLVAEKWIKVDRVRIEQLASKNLAEYVRLLGLRGRLDPTPLRLPTGRVGREPTERLLLGILNDKLRQSLERTFRLLKIAHPSEDIHRVHVAYLSDDKRSREGGVEFLDALLRRRDQERLRRLIRIIGEESSFEEIIERARGLVPYAPPATREQALELLLRDEDSTVAALARLHVAATSGKPSRVIIGSRERPIELALRERAVTEVASHV